MKTAVDSEAAAAADVAAVVVAAMVAVAAATSTAVATAGKHLYNLNRKAALYSAAFLILFDQFAGYRLCRGKV